MPSETSALPPFPGAERQASHLPAALCGVQHALVVVAHPDDESFGLGGVLLNLISGGVSVRLLCLTAGEASTVGAGPDLSRRRKQELQRAASELGLDSAELMDLPDGRLSGLASGEIDGLVASRLGDCDLVVVFEPDGVTGHPDHRAATAAAERVAFEHGIPCLEWGLAGEVAESLRRQFGVPFTHIDHMGSWPFELIVDRQRQRAAISCHLSQDPSNPVLERRLDLEQNRELVFLRQPPMTKRLARLGLEFDRLATGRAPVESRLLLLRRLLGLGAALGEEPWSNWSRCGLGWRLVAGEDQSWPPDLVWGAEVVVGGVALLTADPADAPQLLAGPGAGRVIVATSPRLQAGSSAPLRMLRLEVTAPR